MASNVAPPKNTGGGGFVFEDDVCSWMLACMLAGEPVFDTDLGAPVRLDFQTRPDGWFLDDVLVTTAVGPAHHRFATSVKSNAQFAASTAPTDFVSCIWEQWLHVGSSIFDPTRDFMVLITAPLSGAAAASVSGLAEKSRVADPTLFLALRPLASLAADHLCVQVPGDRIAFAHDLYGGWARLRLLLNHRADVPGFFRSRHESPMWHRALRLLGIYLLEHSGGVADWKAVLSSFGQGEMGVVHDVLLEAPVFAVNARELLDAVFPDLVADDGLLLRRLLTRFLAFATVPNTEMVAVARSAGMDANAARATYRVPYWPYWVDVLAFLHAHRDEVLRAAPAEVTRVVEMWLSFAPEGTIRRAEAAELAVMLGRYALSTRDVYGGHDWARERERFYVCALSAAHERPEDVVSIALTAAERVARPASAEDPSPARRRRRRGLFGGTGIMRGPWPDGPLARVDEALQNVVLDGAGLRDLYRIRPSVAREVVLATLIEEPREEDWNDQWMRRKDLGLVDRHKWLPGFYTHGPFLMCLRENFTEGLELVMRLVDFAAERAEEYAKRELNEWRARVIAEGRSEVEVDEFLASVPPRRVALLDGDRT